MRRNFFKFAQKFFSIVILGMLLHFQNSAVANEPLPIDYWAVRSSMSSATLSPNGERLAFLRNTSKDGNPIIEIHNVDNMGAEEDTIRLDSKKMEFVDLDWVGDDFLLFVARQQVRRRIEGVNQGTYEVRLQAYDVAKRKWVKLANNEFGFVSIVNILPHSPDEILISTVDTPPGDLAFSDFIRADYYRLNLKTGKKKAVIRGNDKNAQAFFDNNGVPRFSQGYDNTKGDLVYYYRPLGGSGWTEVFRRPAYGYDEDVRFVGWSETDSNIAYVTAYRGEDTNSLWEFDLAKKSFGEKVFQHKEVDIYFVRGYHNSWREPNYDGGGISGVVYATDKRHTEWFSSEEQALFEGLEQAIPNAYHIAINGTSRDGTRKLISNRGPRDPGSFYLLKDGALQYIGGSSPHISPEELADVKFIKYPTRDGDSIPAYLTVPNSEGPWPLIVLPHGGPHIHEVVDYDEWGQFLANNGYLVMQPEYRGSRGWGLDHWKKSFGQWGKLMADDKDDGVKYLIEQGMTTKDRVAMFGWSYGGYAALAAAVRNDPQPYQCVVSGAPVSDLPQARGDFAKGIEASERYIDETYDGLNPLGQAKNTNVPVMLIHGDVDQRVPYYHAQRWARKMKGMKKSEDEFKLVTLEKADHFSNTLFYDHQKTLYTEMLEWLQNKCGPGGL